MSLLILMLRLNLVYKKGMKTNLTQIFTLVVCIVSMVAPLGVSAQESNISEQTLLTANAESETTKTSRNTSATSDREQRLAELKEKRGQERCTILQRNIQNLAQIYDKGYANQLGRYRRVITNLNAVIQKLTEAGKDASVLQTQKAKLEAGLTQLENQYAAIIAKLNQAKESACAEGAGNSYSTMVEELKTMIRNLRTKSIEVKEIITKEMLPALQSLRPARSSTSSSATSSAN